MRKQQTTNLKKLISSLLGSKARKRMLLQKGRQIYPFAEGFKFNIVTFLAVFIMVMFIPTIGFSQENEITVSGTVISQEDGAGLPGVTIIIKGTTTGTVTDINGNYSITVDENSILVFSYVGFLTKEVPVNGRTLINVELSPALAELDEIVVVGYGFQKKINLTGAVGVVEAEQLETRAVTRLEQALQGQVSGLQIVQTGGQPGAEEIALQIRGVSTPTANPVLTLIDGVPSSIDQINPNDVESISILKDAASAAIYGARASGGVILITTKTGRKGETRVSLNSRAGIASHTRLPEKVTALDHALVYNEATVNSGMALGFSDEAIERFSSPDWVDHNMADVVFRNAPMLSNNISISGGGDFHDYFLSVGHLKQEGIIINTDYERLNIQANQNIKLSDKFNLSVKLGYAPSSAREPRAGSLGSLMFTLWGRPKTSAHQVEPGKYSTTSLARAMPEGGETMTRRRRLSGNFSLDYDLSPDLRITGSYGIVRNDARLTDYAARFTLWSYDDETDEFIPFQEEFNSLNVSNSTNILNNANLLFNYSKALGDHNISVLGGTTAEWYLRYSESMFTQDFLTDNIYTISAGSQDKSLWNMSGTAADWSLASLISRVSYSYKDKYLLEGTIRYDGSSRFTEDIRWGLFPSVSAGWIASREDFLKDNRVLTFLKFRGSYGQLGNNNVGFYPFSSDLAQSVYYFGGSPQRGVRSAGTPNPLLTWETKETYNLGIETRFFNQLLEVNVDLFRERTDDILLRLPLPTTFGQSDPYQNAGIVDNRGWELELRHRHAFGDFNYGITFHVSDATNKIVDLGGVTPVIIGHTIREIGYPMDMWYGLRAIGYFQTEEEVQNSPFQLPGTLPGDIKYEWNGGDPNSITADDRVILGRSDPRYPYGITLHLSYKNFMVTVFGQGVMDHRVWSNGRTAMNFERPGTTIMTYHLDYWSPENPNARFPNPRVGTGDAREGHNDRFSSFWLEQAAYFRLKNIELGYRIPDNLSNRLNIRDARIYLSGENLVTFTNYLGYDPEIPSGTEARMVERRYPLSKVINLGVNVNF